MFLHDSQIAISFPSSRLCRDNGEICGTGSERLGKLIINILLHLFQGIVGLLILCNFLHSFSWRVSRDQDIFTMLTLVFIRAKCITSLRIIPLLNVILRICYPLLRLINVVRGF